MILLITKYVKNKNKKITIRKNETKPNRVSKEKIILTGGLETYEIFITEVLFAKENHQIII